MPPSLLGRYRAELEEALRAAIPAGSPALLYSMMRYHLGWEDEQGRLLLGCGGKGLRPSLCLWACEAVGGHRHQALPAAVALELLHNFSLVHDDVQDGDTERRHRPTVWSVWGQPQAINAGNSLLILARLAMMRLEERGVSPAKVIEACRVLDNACLIMTEGQCLDIGFESESQVSVEAYLEMALKKTGALLAASLCLGALVGSNEDMAGRFGRCGRLLGMAFQIRDDILGVWGSAQVTGKPVAADIRRRKKSLPVVYALVAAQDEVREELQRLYSQGSLTNGDVARVVNILERVGAREYSQGMAEERIAEALAELTQAGIVPGAYRDFEELAAFLLDRDF